MRRLGKALNSPLKQFENNLFRSYDVEPFHYEVRPVVERESIVIVLQSVLFYHRHVAVRL